MAKKKPASKLFDLKQRWFQRFAYLKAVNPQDVIDDTDAHVTDNICAGEPNDWLIHRYLVWLAATDDGQVTDCEWEGYDDLTKVEQRLYEWIDEHHPSCYATVYDLDERRELDFERTSGICWKDTKLAPIACFRRSRKPCKRPASSLVTGSTSRSTGCAAPSSKPKRGE